MKVHDYIKSKDTTEKRVLRSFWVDSAMYAAAKDKAGRDGISMSEIMRSLLELYLQEGQEGLNTRQKKAVKPALKPVPEPVPEPEDVNDDDDFVIPSDDDDDGDLY